MVSLRVRPKTPGLHRSIWLLVRLGCVQAILMMLSIGDMSGQSQRSAPPKPPPPPYQITQDFDGTFYPMKDPTGFGGGGTHYCTESGNKKRKLRCHTITLSGSPHRLIDVDLTWRRPSGRVDPDTELGFEILREGRILIARSQKSGSAARMAPTAIPGNTTIVIQVFLLAGNGPVDFDLKATRSNVHSNPYVPEGSASVPDRYNPHGKGSGPRHGSQGAVPR